MGLNLRESEKDDNGDTVVVEWRATLNGRYLNNTFYAKNVTHMHLVKDGSVLALVNRLIAGDTTLPGGIGSVVGGGTAIYTGIGLCAFGPWGIAAGIALMAIGASTVALDMKLAARILAGTIAGVAEALYDTTTYILSKIMELL